MATTRTVKKCSVCGEPKHHAKGLCERHYWQRHRGVKNPHRRPRQPRDDAPRSLWRTTIRFHTAHDRCRNMWGRAAEHPCIGCGGEAKDWAYDGTDPTQIYGPDYRGRWMFYSRFPEFYMPMCRGCHRTRDGIKLQQELHTYRLADYKKPEQEFELPKVPERIPEESYAQNVRTVTRSRSTRGERVIHVGRHPRDGRPPGRCRSRQRNRAA